MPKKAIAFTLQSSSVVASVVALKYRRAERKEDLDASDGHGHELVLGLVHEEYWHRTVNDVHQ